MDIILKNTFIRVIRALHPARLSPLATYLLKDEAISGKLIIGVTLLALFVANTALGAAYSDLWHTNLSIGLGDWILEKDLKHWVDDGLMALFFLAIGLELKREIVNGELRKFRTAVLPFAAAVGGMLVPALIYMAFNAGSESSSGWAIPMATDVAFAVGIIAFVGKGIPASIRLFLLTLAIVDDIGTIVVIALFYNVGTDLPMLGSVALLILITLFLQKKQWLTMPTFVGLGIILWLAIDASGIQAGIAGAIVGLLAPLTARAGRRSIAERLERVTIPISTLVVVPIFVFANTGISLASSNFQGGRTFYIASGIILGLVAGKFIGILATSWLMVKLKFAELPTDSNWSHITGVALLAGIGFTVSIFVTELAFTQAQFITVSKISIFVASIISGVLGLLVLRFVARK